VTHLVKRLSDLGVRTEIWQVDPTCDDIGEQAIGDVRVFTLPSRSRISTAIQGLPAKTRAFIGRRESEIDLVHLHSVFTPHNVSIGREVTKPYIVSPRGGYSAGVLSGRNRLAKAAWMRIREHRYLREAAALHAVSEEEKERLEQLTGHPRVVYIPNAVEARRPRETRVPGAKQLLFIGRLAVRQKGLDLLLAGYAQYLRSGGLATDLVIAGSDFRGGKAQAERLSHELTISEHVTFPGPIYGEDKAELLSTCFAFVHTSRWEGLPFAVLEALAAARPVLVTPETNLGRFVEAYGAGVVVEPTAESIAQGMHQLSRADQHSYEAMQRGAERLVAEKFSWPQVTREMIELYQRVLSRSGIVKP